MIPFVGVTSHYIDSEWTLRTGVLAFTELGGSHSGENLGSYLYDCVSTNGISRKVWDNYYQ